MKTRITNIPALLLAGGLLAAAGCANGTKQIFAEKKFPGAATAPRVSQVATAGRIVGRAGLNDNGAKLGHSIAVCDLNGDNIADIAAGMPGDNGGRGSIALIYGSAAGMDLDNPDLSTHTRLTASAATTPYGGDRAGDQFGFSLACGDFNGDGISDLAAGAPYRSVSGQAAAGEVFVFLGNRTKGAAGLVVDKFSFTQTGSGAGNEAGDHFGFALTAGDFDGDGYTDLAIGAPDEDLAAYHATNAGAVFIRYGGANGLRGDPGYHFITAATRSLTTGPNAPQNNERFGYSLAAAQLHNNQYRPSADLVVGAPGHSITIDSVTSGPTTFPGAGLAYVYRAGFGQRWFNHTDDVLPNLWPLGITGFGSSLAIGDFDGDTHRDVAIGAPDAGYTTQSSGGFVFVATADGAGRTGSLAYPDDRSRSYVRLADHHFDTGERYLTQLPIGQVENGDRHGAALAAADFNRDGFCDLAVGAPGENWDGATHDGVVYIYMGGDRGLRREVSFQYFLDQKPVGANETGDQFGFALAAGNVDGDRGGFPDLVIGAPWEDNGGIDAGAVFLARTESPASGPFDGTWTGTVNGDNGTHGTLTMQLSDRDADVAGSARLQTITKSACGLTDIDVGGSATVVASKVNANGTPLPNATHATGTLSGLRLPGAVNGINLSMDVDPVASTLSGSITVTSDYCDVTVPVRNLTRVP